MGLSSSREALADMDSDEAGDLAQRPALEPRRNQGGQRASEILYNLEQLYRSGQLRVTQRTAVRTSPRPRKSMKTQVPVPDTTLMDQSDYKQRVLWNCGLEAAYCRLPPYGSVDVRCISDIRPLRACERVQMMHKHIPSGQSSVVVSSDEKLFCGLHSRDGNVFLTSGQDQLIRVFDTSRCCRYKEPFKLIRSFDARDVGWSVLDVRLSTCGRYLAYSSWSDSVYLATVHTSTSHSPVHLTPPHPNSCGVFSLAFSHDDSEILCGANRGDIYVCGIDVGTSQRIDAHSDDVNSVAFADQSSQILYSGSDDATIKIWDRRNLSENRPKPCGVFLGHSNGVTYLDPHDDGRHLISTGKDQSIKLWDLRAPSPLAGIEENRRAILSSSYDYRHRRKDWSFFGKRLASDTSIMTYYGPQIYNTLIRARFSPYELTASRFIYSGDADGHVFVIDALTGEQIRRLEKHRSVVRDVSWHPKRPEIVSTSWDGTQRLWSYCEDYTSENEDSDKDSDDDE